MNEVAQKLGLSEPPMPTYIFVGDSGKKDCHWYTMDYKTDEKIPIEQSAIYGRVTNIKMVKKIWKNKPSIKLDIHLLADKPYVIRSGVDTQFARGFLLAIQTIDDFEEVLCISVVPGNEQNVVFCKLYYGTGHLIKYEYNKDTKLLPIIQSQQHRLGVDVQTYDQVMKGDEHKDGEEEKKTTQSPPQNTNNDVQQNQPPSMQEPPEEPPPPADYTSAPPTQQKPESEQPADPNDIKKAEDRIPAPIAAAARKLGPDYYATQADDMITLQQLGRIRSLSLDCKVNDTEECLELMGSDSCDLSQKGAVHFIAHLERKLEAANKK